MTLAQANSAAVVELLNTYMNYARTDGIDLIGVAAIRKHDETQDACASDVAGNPNLLGALKEGLGILQTKVKGKLASWAPPEDELVVSLIEKIKPNTMVAWDGLVSLIDQARFCEENGIEGAFVELGCWKGGALGAMALANMEWGKKRRDLHGFDSFQGLPMPRADKDDMPWASVLGISASQCDGSLRPARATLLEASQMDVERLFVRLGYPLDHIYLRAGWFQDTVPAAWMDIDKIAILRLDGDLYDSYALSLDCLYDLVVPGGFVIFDDWDLKGCREAVGDFFSRRGIRAYLSQVDYSIRFLQKAA
jgi:O-methyltransferase